MLFQTNIFNSNIIPQGFFQPYCILSMFVSTFPRVKNLAFIIFSVFVYLFIVSHLPTTLIVSLCHIGIQIMFFCTQICNLGRALLHSRSVGGSKAGGWNHLQALSFTCLAARAAAGTPVGGFSVQLAAWLPHILVAGFPGQASESQVEAILPFLTQPGESHCHFLYH